MPYSAKQARLFQMIKHDKIKRKGRMYADCMCRGICSISQPLRILRKEIVKWM